MADDRIVVKFEAVVDKFVAGVKSMNEGMTTFGNKIGNVGKQMTRVGAGFVKVGIAMAAPLVAAIKVTSDFESAITNAASVTGATGEEFERTKDKLAELARTLGETTVFSASQAADAFFDLASKGFDVANMSIAELEPILNLAAATQTDLTRTTEIMTSTLRAFGLETTDMVRIADVFAKSNASSAATMDKLGEAMKFVAPVAKATGVSLEETTAILSKFFDAGLEGSMAGTALRTILIELEAPGTTFQEVLKKLKIDIDDFADSSLTATEKLELLKAEGASSADIFKAFQKRAGPAVATLIDIGEAGTEATDAVKKLNQELIGAGGTAQEISGLQLKSLKNIVELLKSAFDSVAITIGTVLLPKLKEFTKVFTERVRNITKFAKEHKEEFEKLVTSYAKWTVRVLAAGVALIILGKALVLVNQVVLLFTKLIIPLTVKLLALSAAQLAVAASSVLMVAIYVAAAVVFVAFVVTIGKLGIALFDLAQAQEEQMKSQRRLTETVDGSIDQFVKAGQLTDEQAEKIRKLSDAEQRREAILESIAENQKARWVTRFEQIRDEIEAETGRAATIEEVNNTITLIEEGLLEKRQAILRVVEGITEEEVELLKTVRDEEEKLVEARKEVERGFLNQREIWSSKTLDLLQAELDALDIQVAGEVQLTKIRETMIAARVDAERAAFIVINNLNENEIQLLKDGISIRQLALDQQRRINAEKVADEKKTAAITEGTWEKCSNAIGKQVGELNLEIARLQKERSDVVKEGTLEEQAAHQTLSTQIRSLLDVRRGLYDELNTIEEAKTAVVSDNIAEELDLQGKLRDSSLDLAAKTRTAVEEMIAESEAFKDEVVFSSGVITAVYKKLGDDTKADFDKMVGHLFNAGLSVEEVSKKIRDDITTATDAYAEAVIASNTNVSDSYKQMNKNTKIELRGVIEEYADAGLSINQTSLAIGNILRGKPTPFSKGSMSMVESWDVGLKKIIKLSNSFAFSIDETMLGVHETLLNLADSAISAVRSMLDSWFGYAQILASNIVPKIRDAFRRMSPLTRLSPSLVDQTRTGADQIVGIYEVMTDRVATSFENLRTKVKIRMELIRADLRKTAALLLVAARLREGFISADLTAEQRIELFRSGVTDTSRLIFGLTNSATEEAGEAAPMANGFGGARTSNTVNVNIENVPDRATIELIVTEIVTRLRALQFG